MNRSIVLALALTLLSIGCRATHEDPPHASAPPRAVAIELANAEPPAAADPKPLLADAEVGPLIERLSEKPGNFPSENYVTNETSLLHVAAALRAPKLRDRAYVGVGPEQNYTYLALLEPRVAYVVDIRRGNLLEHLIFRGCFEAGKTRAEFLSALLARREPAQAAPDPALRAEGIARTKALLVRLAIARAPGDDKAITQIHEAFARHGLAIAYTMLDSDRRYPTLGENFAARDPEGEPASFMATEETYARVRRMVLDNRVIPLVGDFGGKHALRAVAADMTARGLALGVFYASNVEQYLFEQKTYGTFVESVRAMPRDDESLVVRVWFDAGRPHPAQRPGHRTTQLAVPANAFLARATKKPLLYYWDVVNQTAE